LGQRMKGDEDELFKEGEKAYEREIKKGVQ